MKNIALLSTLSIALLASFAAQAADTTELKVKGVIRPAACTPSFTGGGVVDYGTIAAKDVPANAPKLLGEKTVPFAVTCDGPAKIAVRAIDNRASSVVPGLVANIPTAGWGGSGTLPDAYARGLGTVAGKNIGVYTVRLMQSSFNAVSTSGGSTSAVDLIYDKGDGSWARSGGGHFPAGGNERKAFSTPGTTVPGSYTSLTGTLAVSAVIDKGANLPLNQEIPLDGSTTLEVQYL